jgi:hypothetical protein
VAATGRCKMDLAGAKVLRRAQRSEVRKISKRCQMGK